MKSGAGVDELRNPAATAAHRFDQRALNDAEAEHGSLCERHTKGVEMRRAAARRASRGQRAGESACALGPWQGGAGFATERTRSHSLLASGADYGGSRCCAPLQRTQPLSAPLPIIMQCVCVWLALPCMQCCAAPICRRAPRDAHARTKRSFAAASKPSGGSAVQAGVVATGLSEAEARVEDDVPARNPRTAAHADSPHALQRRRMRELQRRRMRDRLAALARILPGVQCWRTYASAAMACAGVPVCGHGTHSRTHTRGLSHRRAAALCASQNACTASTTPVRAGTSAAAQAAAGDAVGYDACGSARRVTVAISIPRLGRGGD